MPVARAKRSVWLTYMLCAFFGVMLAAPGVAGAQVQSAAKAKVPASFFGLVNENAFVVDSGPERDRILTQTADSGATMLRHTFHWNTIEPERGRFDFSYYDRWVRDTSQKGIGQLAVLFDPPAFRSSRPKGNTQNGTFPPKSNADFAAFARKVVQRYGPTGSFWKENPTLPKRPIRAWQVWGEPNVKSYWPTGPNPRQYVAMLKTVSRAIRSVDKGAEIVTGSLPNTANGTDPFTFLRGMYAAGAKGSYNTVAINPYAPQPEGVLALVRQMRTLMKSKRDSASLWITELGWATGGRRVKYTTNEAGQASRVSKVLGLLANQARALKLRGFIYFNWQDSAPYAPLFADFWGLHTGLLKVSGEPKPAYNAFRTTVLRLTGKS